MIKNVITAMLFSIIWVIVGSAIPYRKLVGKYTVSDIVKLGENAITQCQKDLPRSKHCQLVITAKVEDKTTGVK